MDEPTTTGATEGFGLMFYNARWYDPGINQFSSPDTLIPDLYNSLDWNRYSYARYNPLLYSQCTSLGILCRVVGEDEPFELLSGADAIGEQFFCF